MPKVHPKYVCHCRVPAPWVHQAEDTGLCRSCRGVYDERLYEMRLRQHVGGYTYDSVSDFIAHHDPAYARLLHRS